MTKKHPQFDKLGELLQLFVAKPGHPFFSKFRALMVGSPITSEINTQVRLLQWQVVLAQQSLQQGKISAAISALDSARRENISSLLTKEVSARQELEGHRVKLDKAISDARESKEALEFIRKELTKIINHLKDS